MIFLFFLLFISINCSLIVNLNRNLYEEVKEKVILLKLASEEIDNLTLQCSDNYLNGLIELQDVFYIKNSLKLKMLKNIS